MGWDYVERKVSFSICGENTIAVEYTSMLDDYYQPFVEHCYPRGYIFQQDEAPSNTAKRTQDYFMTEDMQALP